MNSLPILCCGPTPALQRALRFDAWDAPGDVVRTRHITLSVGGKATNAARAVTRAGGQATVLSPVGGMLGRRVRDLLAAEGLEAIWIEVAAETRTCQTLLDAEGHRIRELVEDALPLSLPEWGEMFSQAERALHFHQALLLCGSLPDEAPDEVYATLIELAHAAGKRVVIDAKGPPLEKALPLKPDLVKINRSELQATTGQEEIPEGMRALQARGAKNVMITDGPQQAWLLSGKRLHRYTLPTIQPVNPIGGGDTVTGVTAQAWCAGEDLPAAARRGLAAGTAQTLTHNPAEFDLEDARNFFKQIKQGR